MTRRDEDTFFTYGFGGRAVPKFIADALEEEDHLMKQKGSITTPLGNHGNDVDLEVEEEEEDDDSFLDYDPPPGMGPHGLAPRGGGGLSP
jgi:hypothetical protein